MGDPLRRSLISGAIVATLVIALVAVASLNSDDLEIQAPGTGTTTTSPRTSTTAQSAPTSTRANDAPVTPCVVTSDPSGPLLDIKGPDRPAAQIDTQDVLPQGAQPKPANWEPPADELDWDGDQQPDAISIQSVDTGPTTASGTVTVHGSREFTVTNVSPGDPRSPTQPRVAALSDATGDGTADLIVVRANVVAVIAGGDPNALPASIDFSELLGRPGVWISPPVTVPSGATTPEGNPANNRIPGGEASVVPLWDITGDGVNDFAIDGRGPHRSPTPGQVIGTWYYAGRRCN
jgi:hypothetical protein